MRFLILSISLFFATQLAAQYNGEVKHWTFDTDESEFSLIKGGVEETMYSDGIEGMGVFLNGSSDYFIINNGIDLNEDFSLSFWFQPINAAKSQNILLHIKQDKQANRTARYIRLGIENYKLFFETERGRSFLSGNLNVSNNKWYQLVYAYDGLEMKIFLQGKEVFKSNEVSIFSQVAFHKDILYIGKDYKNSSRFEGIIDEIITYNRPMQEQQATAVFGDKVKVEKPVVTTKPKQTLPKTPPKEPVKPTEEKVVTAPKPTPTTKTDTAPKEKGIDMTASTEKGETKEKKKHLSARFKERNNDIQHTLEVNNTNIMIEVWDFDKFDNDRITVTLNSSPFSATKSTNMLLPRKKDKETLKFNLDSEEVNYLTFYADDMGKYESQNTVGVRIWDGKLRLKEEIQLVLTEASNAVIELKHQPIEFEVITYPTEPVATKPKSEEKVLVVDKVDLENTKTSEPVEFEVRNLEPATATPTPTPQPQEEYVAVLDFAILDPIKVHSTDITVELTPTKRVNDKQNVKVLLNESQIGQPVDITKGAKKVNFNISTQGESVLTIESYLLKKGERSRVNMKVLANGEQVAAYNLKLEHFNIMIPMVFENTKGFKPSNERAIIVTDTALTIQVRDNSKVDGDVITINQEGINILENYTLTEKLHDVKVTLRPNQENLFFFVPVSMGASNTENTAWVQVLSKGVVIHEFSLKSQSKARPAKLRILHKSTQTEK